MRYEDIPHLPFAIREEMARIPDREIDADPEIQALLTKRSALAKRHADLAAALQESMAIAEAAGRQKADAAFLLAEIEQSRGDLALAILMGQAEDAEDASQQAEAAELRRRIELLGIGAKAAQHATKPTRQTLESVSEEMAGVDLALDRRRQLLRAELAMARA